MTLPWMTIETLIDMLLVTVMLKSCRQDNEVAVQRAVHKTPDACDLPAWCGVTVVQIDMRTLHITLGTACLNGYKNVRLYSQQRVGACVCDDAQPGYMHACVMQQDAAMQACKRVQACWMSMHARTSGSNTRSPS